MDSDSLGDKHRFAVFLQYMHLGSTSIGRKLLSSHINIISCCHNANRLITAKIR